jgi:SAM-dependent methyltransferase
MQTGEAAQERPNITNSTPESGGAGEEDVATLLNLLKYPYVHLWKLPSIHRTYRTMSVADTFRRIYQTKSWGDNGNPFFSGVGSCGQASEKYCALAIEFIQTHRVESVVDLGCGDFAVGRQIAQATGARYTGIDVVPELIEHLQHTASGPRVSFQCANIISDRLPSADLYLVRQVLQHLSNEEIAQVLGNLSHCSRVLISEDLPVRPTSYNRDKPHGPDTRPFYGSGVYIEKAPFSIQVKQCWEFPLSETTILRTSLVDQTHAAQQDD